MKLVIPLQMILAALYFYTGEFSMTFALWVVYLISNGSLLVIFISDQGAKPSVVSYPLARISFTVSLFLLEFLLMLQPTAPSTLLWIGLINDAEVLVTGLLLGLLWHDKFLPKSNRS